MYRLLGQQLPRDRFTSGARRPKPLKTPGGEARLVATLRCVERDYGSVERDLDDELGVDRAGMDPGRPCLE